MDGAKVNVLIQPKNSAAEMYTSFFSDKSDEFHNEYEILFPAEPIQANMLATNARPAAVLIFIYPPFAS
jgi:hypothetical protein